MESDCVGMGGSWNVYLCFCDRIHEPRNLDDLWRKGTLIVMEGNTENASPIYKKCPTVSFAVILLCPQKYAQNLAK